MGDETIKVIANTKGRRGEICSELREALHYLDGGQITGAYSRELDDAVKSVKSSEERRLEYMLLWVRDNEMRAEGAVSEAVKIYRDEMHLSDEEITERIMRRFQLDREKAAMLLYEK